MEDKLEQILALVRRATTPDVMSVTEALEFIKELIGELDVMVDALEMDRRRS